MSSRILLTFLVCFTAILLGLLGFYFLIMALLPDGKEQIISYIEYYDQSLFNVATTLIGFASFLFLAGIWAHRRRWLPLIMGEERSSLRLSPQVVKKYIDGYWKEKFPHFSARTDIDTSGDCLNIWVRLPVAACQEEALQAVETELKTLLSKNLGYNDPFYLSIEIE